MRKPLSTLASILTLGLGIARARPSPPTAPGSDREGHEEARPGRRHQQAAARRAQDRLHDERGDLDVGRRLARRADARLRPPRRHLHAARSRAAPAKAITSGPAYDTQPALLPRRQDDRLHERPQRHREHLAHGRRREEPAGPHDREGRLRAQRRPGLPTASYLIARKEDGKRAGIPPVELWMYHREEAAAASS